MAEPATLPQERRVPFGSGEVVIRELSLRKVGQLGGLLAGLAGEREVIAKLGSGQIDQVVEGVARLMTDIPDKLVEVVTMTTDATPDQVMDATPRQVLALLLEVWTLNDLTGVFRGKVAPLAAGRPPATAPEPGGPEPEKGS